MILITVLSIGIIMQAEARSHLLTIGRIPGPASTDLSWIKMATTATTEEMDEITHHLHLNKGGATVMIHHRRQGETAKEINPKGGATATMTSL
jgi:hypothetical protein